MEYSTECDKNLPQYTKTLRLHPEARQVLVLCWTDSNWELNDKMSNSRQHSTQRHSWLLKQKTEGLRNGIS